MSNLFRSAVTVLVVLCAMVSWGATLPGFTTDTQFDEQTSSSVFAPGILVHFNAPGPAKLDATKPTRLIIYTLPNGNSTTWTIGKKTGPGDDWHFNIQHIGAQTRRLRELLPNENIITVYAEASKKSWPTWRKETPSAPEHLLAFLDFARLQFRDYKPRVTLSGHSGGGSFLFGFLNANNSIPEWVDRIAFLDADYGYSAEEGHTTKVLSWLKGDPSRHLFVAAYDDRRITVNGKLVVSGDGGTYRKTMKLISDLGRETDLTSATTNNLIHNTGMNGQVEIFIHENPENKILHTVLVERNGFVAALLSGSKAGTEADKFYADPSYSRWIGN
ncbi:MAG: hypothetical protein K1X53_11525 [Candidatus Sumerlaeaceae bacterium]|nr:hypothetical protein [Candidatus Sumerlaeaceae bacterium]